MSYDHWKTTNPDDQWLESCPQSDEDEAMAAMLGVDVDQYLADKARDRQLPRRYDDTDDPLPF